MHSRRLGQYGGAQWLTYLLLLSAVVGGYLLWVYAPLYIDNYAAMSKCEQSLNETWRRHDEMFTLTRLRRRLAKIRTITVLQDGEELRVPAIDPSEENLQVEIDRSTVPPMLRANISYSRTVVFPFLKKTRVKWFTVACELSLEEVVWN